MNHTSRLFASTILAVAFGSASALALPLSAPGAAQAPNAHSVLPLVRVQLSVSDAQAALEAAMAELVKAQAEGGDVEAAKAKVEAAQAALDAAMAAEAAAPPPAPEAAPAEPQAQEAPPAETAPQPEPPAAEAPAPEPATPPAAEAPAEQPPAAEPPKAEEPAPAQEQPAEQAPASEQPQTEAPATEQPAPAEEPKTEAPAESAPAAEAPAENAPAAETPAETAPAATEAPADTQTQTEPAPAEKKSAEQQDADAKAAAEATQESTVEVTPEATLPVEGGAPVLDSAKEAPAADAPASSTTAEAPAEAAPAAPAPQTDADAQANLTVEPAAIQAPLTEKGRRIERAPEPVAVPEGGRVIKEQGDRFVFQINNQIVIQSDDSNRLRERGSDVYYEELPGGRVREVITRRDGTQIVTVRNAQGEIVLKSKVLPNGREILLAYVPENDRDARGRWHDPGRDLPPLRLRIPVRDYILDATVAEPSDFYRFLDEPPVERIERIYSVDEVKHSARLRDKLRRVDMDTLTFDTGSARIDRSKIADLGNVADAMDRILQDNPGETFLIEGHTDAVGSDESNLILSDERAEAVATALSAVYGIPPENLVTQGYGERYLKIRTQGAERLNRRVTIRRITPLVTPVASR